jgi:FkbM family methyltransferase
MKKLINNFLNLFGYKISNLDFIYDSNLNLINTIKQKKINTVIDVGANEGQFATKIINSGFEGNIISFEPLSSAHTKLLNIVKSFKSHNKVNWIAEKRMAIGNKNKKTIINISGNSESSSILKILPKHTSLKPTSITVGKEDVMMKKMDNYLDLVSKQNGPYLLKIDTQGYEMEVLKGSKNILNIVSYLLVEVSLVELYQGQKLLKDILDFLSKKNFKIWSVDRVMGNKKTGQTYQLDIFFCKI